MQNGQQKNSFYDSVHAIKAICLARNPHDVLRFLFCFFNWRPNASALMKMELCYAVLTSLKREEFTGKVDATYESFSRFCSELLRNFPNLFGVEDFFPETDWGEIWHFNESKFKKIMYGGSFGSTFDFLRLFELLHLPFSQEYFDNIQVRPDQALSAILTIQDSIITNISQSGKIPDDLEHGHLEIPPSPFWEKNLHYLNAFNETLESNYCDYLEIVAIGETDDKILEKDNFFKRALERPILECFFIRCDNLLYPFLPRNYIHNLFNIWGRKMLSLSPKLEKLASQKMLRSFGGFCNDSLEQVQILPYVEVNGIAERFTFAISKGNKLALIYIQDIFTEPDPSKLFQDIDMENIDFSNLKILGMESQRRNKRSDDFVDEKILPIMIFLDIPKESYDRRIQLPRGFSARYLFALDFLAIIGSETNLDKIFGFFEFQDTQGKLMRGAYSTCDIFAAFMQSSGVINKGALHYDAIFIDPLGGGRYRYDYLIEFWNNYPRIEALGNPHAWHSKRKEDGRFEMHKLNSREASHVCWNKNVGVATLLDFTNLSQEQALRANMVAECLIYSLNRHSKQIGKLSLNAISGSFKVEVHVGDFQQPWIFSKSENGLSGILSVDVNKATELFLEPKSRNIEHKLLRDFLELFIASETLKTTELNGALLDSEAEAPGFKLYDHKIRYEYPRGKLPSQISDQQYLTVRKQIAIICRDQSITPGRLDGDFAKKTINRIKDALLSAINAEIAKCNYVDGIKEIIDECEANYYEMIKLESRIIAAADQTVDYDRPKTLQEEKQKFLDLHATYRYLICKFISISPTGTSKSKTTDLASIAKELLRLYAVSDNLHYSLVTDYEVEILDDFQLSLQLPGETEAKFDALHVKQARERLRTTQNQLRYRDALVDTNKFATDINAAFESDLRFSATELLNILDILQFLPNILSIREFGNHVQIDADLLTKSLVRETKIPSDRVSSILDFLTLKPEEVSCCLDVNTGKPIAQPDIPIWEYAKRFSRPEIRPLIRIGNDFIFGTGMVHQALQIWEGSIARFYMPYDFRSPRIVSVLNEAEKGFQDNLVRVTNEILGEVTDHRRKEAKISELFSLKEEVGDVDVLGVSAASRLIFNIECKYIRNPFANKDAKRVGDKIFKGLGKDKSYLSKVERRATYLEENKGKVLKLFGIESSAPEGFSVNSIFVTSNYNYWTLNPPVKTKVTFVFIEDLPEYLKTMIAQ